MKREQTHIGAYVVLRDGETVLLVRKARGPYVGLWDLPGGKIEFGETPEDTARREVREETGITVATLSLSGMYSHTVAWQTPNRDEDYLHHLGVIYVTTETSGELRIGGDAEDAADATWQAIAALDVANLTPFARRALFETDR